MPASNTEKAARWLLYELGLANGPTEAGLHALADGKYHPKTVSQGLQWLRRKGLAEERGGWFLTDEGRRVLTDRVERKARRWPN